MVVDASAAPGAHAPAALESARGFAQPARSRCALDGIGGVVVVSQATPEHLDRLQARAADRATPAPLPRSERDTALVQAWADRLAPLYADGRACNLTGTYSDAYGYSHGLMHARNVIKDFRSFCRFIGREHEPACIGVERHPSGRDVLHFHAIVGGSWTDDELEGAQRLWTLHRGWAVARPITDRAGAVAYAAKHLLKQRAEDHFDFWVPPRAFSSRYERRRYRAGQGVSPS